MEHRIIPPFPGVRESAAAAKENGEALVCIQKQCPGEFICASAYFAQGLPGALEEIYIREGALERLQKAAKALPEGYRFKLWDIWRPLAVQQAIFDAYAAEIAQKQPALSEKEIFEETKKFVFPPGSDVLFPPLHATGGAVDLTIVDEQGAELDMGTGFDYFGDAALPEYYEAAGRDERIRQNRRLLYFALIDAGFIPDSVEWWHFNYGNSAWARWTGNAPVYAGVFSL